MRWGVRKAIEKGNISKLSDHYQKAILKKAKLKERTDREGQKSDAKSSAAGGAALIGLGALGGLAGYGIAKGQVAAQRALMPNAKSYMIMHPAGLYGLSGLSVLGGAAALADAGASAYRATKHGNKSAVKKYKNFSSEMNKAFSKSTRKKIYKYWKKHPEDKWING